MFARYNIDLSFCSNEDEVGKAIRESGIPREDIYVVTKVYIHIIRGIA